MANSLINPSINVDTHPYITTGMSENKAFKMIDGKHDATFTLKNLKKEINAKIFQDFSIFLFALII